MPFSDSTAWIAVGSALGAAALMTLLAIVFFSLVRNRKPASNELERMLAESKARSESKRNNLGRELERAEDESRRSRQLSAIGTTIDLDGVLSRALEAAAALPL